MNGSKIRLAHGSGGRLSHTLYAEVFKKIFHNPYLDPLSDAALFSFSGKGALTIDAYVVEPRIFPGGDLGTLSMSGTINDLVVSGARPRFIAWSLILEEGVPMDEVTRFAQSAQRVAEEAGVFIVTGDTKVVPEGRGDGAYAISAGIGEVVINVGDHTIQPSDAIVITGSIGDHGATIMGCRHNLQSATLQSDCAPLNPLLDLFVEASLPIHSLHDPTRGGVGVILHEVAERTGYQQVLYEDRLPIKPEVKAIGELLGISPLYFACEGRMLIWVSKESLEDLLKILHQHPLSQEATCIGHVQPMPSRGSPVVMETPLGVLRPVDYPSGLQLPRIC